MAAKTRAESILKRVAQLALALPEAQQNTMGSHASFLVRKKPFLYFLNDHHGDGILGINTKVLPGDNQMLIESYPERYYMPAYVGPRGWVGLRLDTGKVDWEEVEDLIRHSYKLLAPKTLAKAVSGLP